MEKSQTGQQAGVFLELGEFASLLLSILCLCALFHTAFLTPVNSFEERILASLQMLVIAAGVCWASGCVFYYGERMAGEEPASIATTFPMKMFWWATAIIFGLFLASWYLQVYFLPPRGLLRH